MAARRSPISSTSAVPSTAPASTAARISAGSSVRRLSSVITRTSARRAVISPHSGRLPRSRSPPAPRTTMTRPSRSAATARRADTAASTASGLWAKSTTTVNAWPRSMRCIRPGTSAPRRPATMCTTSKPAAPQAAIAARASSTMKAPGSATAATRSGAPAARRTTNVELLSHRAHVVGQPVGAAPSEGRAAGGEGAQGRRRLASEPAAVLVVDVDQRETGVLGGEQSRLRARRPAPDVEPGGVVALSRRWPCTVARRHPRYAVERLTPSGVVFGSDSPSGMTLGAMRTS